MLRNATADAALKDLSNIALGEADNKGAEGVNG